MKKYQKDSTPPQISLGFSPNKTGFIQQLRRRSGAGFTLIELLVVITVLGVLATIVLVAVNPGTQMARARNAGRKSDLRQIANAIERYHIFYGQYPVTNTWCGALGSAWYNCGDDWIPGLVASGEIKELPKDPRSGQVNPSSGLVNCREATTDNYYIYYSNGVDYKLLAHCTPEGTMSPTDPFYDWRSYWAWAIYSPGGAGF